MNRIMINFVSSILNTSDVSGRSMGISTKGNLVIRYELSDDGDSTFGSKDSFQLHCDSSGVDNLDSR